MRSDLEQCAVRVMNGGVTPKSSSQEDTVQVPSHHNGKANCVSDDMKDLSLQVNRLLPPLAKKRNVLQLRLQQRRTREQLADQGIMPPLKSPAAFQEQRRSIERSKTGDFLRHKIRGRQEKSDLLNMHILRDSATEGSVQATQMKLKRARLADDLNQKIALRPGPLELVEKNIIPVDSAIKEAAMKVNHGKFLKEEDSYAFEEDSSSDSLSPEQPHSNESQGSVCSSSETKSSDSSSPALAGTRQGSQNLDHNGSPTSHVSQEESLSMMNNSQLTQPIAVPAIVKSKTSDKNRHKKPKDTKPKVKKLKYHQYIPPDQKAEKSPPPMDSAYARLLQQQQLFLQLQILSQQKHQQHSHQRQQNFSFQPLHSSLKQSNEQLPRNSNVSTSTVTSTSASPVKTTYSAQINVSAIKPGPLPSNLDDLKVSELRQQLRIRGLPVSGTKTALIERLRPFKDPSSSSPSSSSDITTVTFPVTPTGSLSSYHSPSSSSALSNGGFYQLCSNSTTPPISPASSDLSVSGSLPDSFSDVTMSSPQFSLHASPRADDGLAAALSGGRLHPEPEGLDAEKDKMLVEKQKVIEELTWKLHQEQRQVEELKMQLHKRKRSHCQQALPQQQAHLHPLPPQQQTIFGVSIKQEHVASSCPLSSKQLKGPPRSCMESLAPCASTVLSNLGGPRCLDASAAGSPAGLSAFLSPQCSPQHSPIAKTASSPQHSSLSSSPNSPYLLSVSSTRGAGDGQSHSPQQSGNRPRTIQIPQKNSGPTVSCSFAPDQRGLTPAFSNSANSGFNRDQHKPKGASIQHKQLTRSQQMDELLDVLIESGVSGGSGISVPKFPRHYEHLPPGQVPFEHAASNGDSHLEALLNSPMGRASEAALLKMSTGERQLEDGGESFTGTHQEKMLGNRDMMEMPLSPMDARISPAAEAQGLSMPFTESPWETMEWLDLTPPSSATGFSTIPQAAPNIFNAEFLDVTDIHLNSTMDLHLEQW
ncbi:myocardin isoform X8 [Paramormyrops kingsleyae]|uniref:myocardin isoform X8 n=1 Tax=Paramormyrops kingsleyae TaxID=1676925 RepID=UPI003B972E04